MNADLFGASGRTGLKAGTGGMAALNVGQKSFLLVAKIDFYTLFRKKLLHSLSGFVTPHLTCFNSVLHAIVLSFFPFISFPSIPGLYLLRAVKVIKYIKCVQFIYIYIYYSIDSILVLFYIF